MKVEVGKKYILSLSPDIIWECVCKVPHAPMPFLLACKEKYHGLLFAKEDGTLWQNNEGHLIEWSPYAGFKKDDLVMVSTDGVIWGRRYFSHAKDGVPYAFPNGKTSWSVEEDGPNQKVSWKFCRRPTKEELNP